MQPSVGSFSYPYDSPDIPQLQQYHARRSSVFVNSTPIRSIAINIPIEDQVKIIKTLITLY
jgi:hypothetical protein